jgi:hypothetical protein
MLRKYQLPPLPAVTAIRAWERACRENGAVIRHIAPRFALAAPETDPPPPKAVLECDISPIAWALR